MQVQVQALALTAAVHYSLASALSSVHKGLDNSAVEEALELVRGEAWLSVVPLYEQGVDRVVDRKEERRGVYCACGLVLIVTARERWVCMPCLVMVRRGLEDEEAVAAGLADRTLEGWTLRMWLAAVVGLDD